MPYTDPVRKPIAREHYEVIIIGGGINGVAIARECARAGKRTLLLEQHDFAAGTTSRATRIIHGGLRYLEHGELGLVRESLLERERLLKERPHLVHPKDFVLAIPKGYGRRSALAIRFGLWLYTSYAHRSHRRSARSSSDVSALEASLDQGLDLNIFSYEDAQCEFPERLTAEWLMEAMQAGAVARNYSKVLEIMVLEGKAHGVVARDLLTGEETAITSDWVINASGPWADEVLRASSIHEKRLIGGVRGSHIVLPTFPGAPHSALYSQGIDGRPIFLIPWAGQLLLGTTEVAQDETPGDTTPSRAEIQYLFLSLRRLFPNGGLRWSDLQYAYAGVRPLPYQEPKPGKFNLGSISRRHKLHDHLEDGVAGLITLVGGKLTTAAKVGRECARAIGARVADPASTLVALGEANGFESTLVEWSRMASQLAHISPASAAAIAEWHGRYALGIAQLAAANPVFRPTLCPHTPHIVAEAVEAVRYECALSLADILLRRVPVALGACWSEECTRTAAHRIGAALGWPEVRVSMEIEDFEAERGRFLCRIPDREPSGKQEPLMLERTV
ncbi:MAG TPA: glycerol-3-phosphate dehydrogenase/oxidase [Terriglobales bacterium]